MARSLDPLLNDGLLEYGTVKTLRDEKTAKKMGEEFQPEGHLFFNFSTINEKFDVFQVGSLSSVDLKIKCYYVQGLQDSHKVKIEHDLFEIVSKDVSRDRRYVFLFLRKVGSWNGDDVFQAT